MEDCAVIGSAKLDGKNVMVAIMDFSYMGGSMGSVLGEKFSRIMERSIAEKAPLILFSASGGARMQEGILSLMQMAKVSALIAKMEQERVPYIVVLTDPTTGGTTASFAMLGDVHIAEPGALIGFAGPRVIEQTIRQKLPKGFQRSEYLLDHGMVDRVVHRREMRSVLTQLIHFYKA
jgi:acetyl-CoA carboxylase carboxyl transferase subunit beta